MLSFRNVPARLGEGQLLSKLFGMKLPAILEVCVVLRA